MRLTSMAQATLSLAVLALPAAVSAQPNAAPGSVPGQDVPARVEQRLGKMHDALGITAAEEALWSQYAQVTRTNADGMGRAFAQRRSATASMSAADNLQSMAAIAAQHAQNMQRLATTFGKLYAAMPPDQKKTADEVLRTPGERPKQ